MPKSRRILTALFLAAAAAAARPALAADDVVVADFEGNAYPTGWVTTGTAFGAGPAHGRLPNQQAVDGFVGKGLVNSYLDGDGSTGTLTSPAFRVDRPFISLLVGGGNHPRKTCVNLVVDDHTVASTTGSDDEHLDWVTWDVSQWKGQQAKVVVVDDEKGGWGHINVDQVVQTDHPPVPPESAVPLYRERYRPQFHFSPDKNWMNDPNGLVYFDGEYHLFFQRDPARMVPRNLTWGNAVSTDLVHWQQLSDAIRPDKLGTIFSGSAVVDAKNTTGFGTGGKPPLVAMYTAAGRPFTQCIAYSNDRGRTFTKYAGNPVLPNVGHGNRDPHLIWYEPTQRWVVIIYKADGTHTFSLFESADLKKWDHLQDVELPGSGECPDIFPIALDGDSAKTKWVITCADGGYMVGAFDGRRYSIEQERQPSDRGNGFYAVQSYFGAPDNRRIQIAWMRGGRYPHMPFNQQMTFPADLALHTTPEGMRLFRSPVKEIESIYGDKSHTWSDVAVSADNPVPLDGLSGGLYDVRAEIDVGDATEVGLTVRGTPVTYNVADKTLHALGDAPLLLENGHLSLRLLVDRTSLETFANEGRVSLSSTYLPGPDEVAISLFARGGTAHVKSINVHELKPAWR